MRHAVWTRLAARLLFPIVLGAEDAASAATIPNHVSSWVAKAGMIGPASDSTRVTISVYLNFTNQAGAAALAQAVSTPGNAQYGHYLTPSVFRAQFAPSPASLALVEKTLTSHGFVLGRIATSGHYVEASGTVAQIKALFNVTQNIYAFGGRHLRANAEDPTVPTPLVGIVSAIAGLDETGALRQPMNVRSDGYTTTTAAALNAPASTGAAPPPVASGMPPSHCDTFWGDLQAVIVNPTPFPAAGYGGPASWVICGYSPQQIQAAYGIDKIAQTGQGMRVAIVGAFASQTIFSTTTLGDANLYSKNHHLPLLTDTTFQQILPAGIYTAPASNACGPQGWFGQESIDVEAIHSVAPHATLIYVAAADCYTLQDYLYDAIDNGVANIISNSWGEIGEYSSPAEQATENAGFIQAAIEGISVVFASGNGSDLSQTTGITTASWPSSSPWVTAVGGTSLALTSPSGTKAEWGWGSEFFSAGISVTSPDGTAVTQSQFSAQDSGFLFGSGGGPSLSQLQPSYQSQIHVCALLRDVTIRDDGELLCSLSDPNTVDLTLNALAFDAAVTPFASPHRVTPDIAMDADPFTGFLYGETFLIAGNPLSDFNCKPTTAVKEYCEMSIGGTGLSAPLFAGVLALADEGRVAAGLPPLGFANPTLYALPVSAEARPQSATAATAIVDPFLSDWFYWYLTRLDPSILRDYAGTPNSLELIRISGTSTPGQRYPCCEGADGDYLLTEPGYDAVTGLGVPFVPQFIKALTHP